MSTLKNKKAKIFPNGNSQAIRLPKEFRFSGAEVNVSFHGDSVLLSPISMSISTLPRILDQFDDSFARQKLQQFIY